MDEFMESLEVIDGHVDEPYFGVIYGAGGCGKSWLASYAEDAFFIPIEAGTNLIPAKKFNKRPANAGQFFQMMKWLIKNPDSAKTVIIDSAGFLQTIFYADVIANNPTEGDKVIKSIGEYGYHRGYALVMPLWERMLAGIDALQAKGINVILITHSTLKTETTEGGDSYKRHDFALQNSNNGDVCELLRRRSDWVLYMESKVKTRKVANEFGGKAKTVAIAGSRPTVIVHTRATSSFYAKVRARDENTIEDSYEIDPKNTVESSVSIIETITKQQ